MSCYSPKTLYHFVDERTGEIKYIFSNEPGVSNELFKHELSHEFYSIPCGKCLGCRIDKSRIWADRMMLELDHSKKAVFITLTYRDDDLPYSESGFPTLKKKDFQDFMKRLRYYFPNNEIRYFLVGEYGPKHFRPHGHAIIFGLGLDEITNLEKDLIGKNEFGQNYYNSDKITSIWNHGFTSASEVSWRTCAYVARYCTKKLVDSTENLPEDVVPEFALMSRDPGIGGFYAYENKEKLKDSYVFISNPYDIESGSKKIFLPHYVKKNLQLLDPDLYYQQMDERRHFAEDNFKLKLQETDLDVISYLETQNSIKRRQVEKLKRGDL